MATGESFHSLSFQFRISRKAVSYTVKSCCDAWTGLPRIIRSKCWMKEWANQSNTKFPHPTRFSIFSQILRSAKPIQHFIQHGKNAMLDEMLDWFASALTKTKRNRKWKIQHTLLEKRTLCFNSYESRKLKVKLMSSRSRKRKESIFVTFIFSEGSFFNTCVLSQCIVYRINFENIYIFISKNITSNAFSLVFLNRQKPSVHPSRNNLSKNSGKVWPGRSFFIFK